MTAKELVHALTSLDPNDDVVICCDGAQAKILSVRLVETRTYGRTFAVIHIGDDTCVELRDKHGLLTTS
jgi:hypothetical protein